ncbi:MAG: SEC-C metal-binding domain-containing protein, partial [Ancalomicrobiaceae bacterium]|nr:SEC-C metal-binding domain-containing protein [Ancalomicrobiaceae bacterium]
IDDADEREAGIARIKAEVAEMKGKAIEAGGLYVLGTERHESRRIDNQLRGRSGRQGDPGHSHFFLSLQDDLMRIFGTDRMDGVLQRLGLKEDEAIVHPWINKALEKAQQKVEARNFDIRKNLLKFDNVMNDQRKVVFEQRVELMESDDVQETIASMRHDIVHDTVKRHIPENAYAEQWDMVGLKDEVTQLIGLDLGLEHWAKEEGIANEEVEHRINEAADAIVNEKLERYGRETMNYIEKQVLLQSLDHLWREHLVTLDHLRQVIGFRGYGQRDPLNEYRTEAFTLFEAMLSNLRKGVTAQMMRVELVRQEQPIEQPREESSLETPLISASVPDGNPFEMAEAALFGAGQSIGAAITGPESFAAAGVDPDDPTTWGRVNRNGPCPCGSGKKYKHCHGKLA